MDNTPSARFRFDQMVSGVHAQPADRLSITDAADYTGSVGKHFLRNHTLLDVIAIPAQRVRQKFKV